MVDLEKTEVTHTRYGLGVITKFENNNMTVEFEKQPNEPRKLKYPAAFEKHLRCTDEKIQETIINDLDLSRNTEENKYQDIVKQIGNKTRSIDNGFGVNYNLPHLSRNPILTYSEVEMQFGIKISGFGKGINITDSSIVLISSIDTKKTDFVYHDRWTEEGDYIYSGEGKNGDQSLTRGNKAIVSAADENKVIHLFVKFSPQEYYYQGVFRLVDYNYENDIDESGNTRKEYKFRLRKVI